MESSTTSSTMPTPTSSFEINDFFDKITQNLTTITDNQLKSMTITNINSYDELKNYQENKQSNLFFKENVQLTPIALKGLPPTITDPLNFKITANVKTLYLKIHKDDEYPLYLANISNVIPATVDKLLISLNKECKQPIPIGFVPDHVTSLIIMRKNIHHEAQETGIFQKGSIPISVKYLAAPYQSLNDESGFTIPETITHLNIDSCTFKDGKFGLSLPISVTKLNLYLTKESGPIEKGFIPESVTDLNLFLEPNHDGQIVLKEDSIPFNITKLNLDSTVTQTISSKIISPSVEKLYLNQPFSKDSIPMNGNLKTLSVSKEATVPDEYKVPESVTHLRILGCEKGLPNGFEFPPNVTKLECDFVNVKSGMIPKSVKELEFYSPVDSIELGSIPSDVTSIDFKYNISSTIDKSIFKSLQSLNRLIIKILHINQPFEIPNSLKHFEIQTGGQYPLDSLPEGLETLIFCNPFDDPIVNINLPKSVASLQLQSLWTDPSKNHLLNLVQLLIQQESKFKINFIDKIIFKDVGLKDQFYYCYTDGFKDGFIKKSEILTTFKKLLVDNYKMI
eukprot:gene10100-12388_t